MSQLAPAKMLEVGDKFHVVDHPFPGNIYRVVETRLIDGLIHMLVICDECTYVYDVALDHEVIAVNFDPAAREGCEIPL